MARAFNVASRRISAERVKRKLDNRFVGSETVHTAAGFGSGGVYINGRIYSSNDVGVGVVKNVGRPAAAFYASAEGGAGAVVVSAGGGTTASGGAVDGDYLLRSGILPMLGNLDMGNRAIANVALVDGRDVSADGAILDTIQTAPLLALATNTALTSERVLALSNVFSVTDGGAGGNYNVALATPGTLSATSTNVATGAHSHAVTASDNPGAAVSLLKTAADGNLTLTKLTTPLIASTGDLTITPAGGDVILDDGVNLWSSAYVSEVAGWRMPATGAADILSVTTNELTSRQSLYAGATGFRVLFHTHDYDHVHVVVNPGPFWNLDEQFGVDIDDNLLVRGYIVGKHAIQLPGAMMICHYDGPEPYETNTKGNAMGHMGQVGTESGGVIYRPGKFGKAVQIASSTVNLVNNPSFETHASWWSLFRTGTATGSIARSTEQYYYGVYSYKITKDGGGNGDDYGAYTPVTLIEGQAYTASAWIYVTSLSGTTPGFGLYFQDGTNTATSSLSAVTTGWVRLTATISSAASTAGTVLLYFSSGTGTAYIDAIQCELGSRATPFADGSLGVGHGWILPDYPHSSPSYRDAATLSYAAESVLSPTGLTIGAWVRRSSAGAGYIVSHPSLSIEFL